MKKVPILSVIIISYNQEKYLSNAIESVLNQETKYNYEIILADDCSTDNSKDILIKYQKLYPEKIIIAPREHNLGAPANSFDACCRGKGKYITILEGDDYWCSNQKIEKQIDFLEEHPEYFAVSHLQKGIDENGKNYGNFPKGIKKDCDITMKDFMHEKIFSETASVFKNVYHNKKQQETLKKLATFSKNVGDYQHCIFFLDQGKVRVIAEPLMVYRIQNNANNYNSKYSIDEICLEHLKITAQLDNYYEHRYNFFQKYARFYALGITYSFLKGKVNSMKEIKKSVPNNLRLKLFIYYPIAIAKIFIQKIF